LYELYNKCMSKNVPPNAYIALVTLTLAIPIQNTQYEILRFLTLLSIFLITLIETDSFPKTHYISTYFINCIFISGILFWIYTLSDYILIKINLNLSIDKLLVIIFVILIIISIIRIYVDIYNGISSDTSPEIQKFVNKNQNSLLGILLSNINHGYAELATNHKFVNIEGNMQSTLTDFTNTEINKENLKEYRRNFLRGNIESEEYIEKIQSSDKYQRTINFYFNLFIMLKSILLYGFSILIYFVLFNNILKPLLIVLIICLITFLTLDFIKLPNNEKNTFKLPLIKNKFIFYNITVVLSLFYIQII